MLVLLVDSWQRLQSFLSSLLPTLSRRSLLAHLMQEISRTVLGGSGAKLWENVPFSCLLELNIKADSKLVALSAWRTSLSLWLHAFRLSRHVPKQIAFLVIHLGGTTHSIIFQSLCTKQDYFNQFANSPCLRIYIGDEIERGIIFG